MNLIKCNWKKWAFALGMFTSFTAYSQDQEVLTKKSTGEWGKTFDYEYYQKNNTNINCTSSNFRTIDGTCNNISDPTKYSWGATHIPMMRYMPAVYGSADPMNALGGENRKSPREISNIVCSQTASMPSADSLSNFTFTWGQFIDHDLTIVPENENEAIMIPLPANEPTFTAPIPFLRSEVMEGTGVNTPREQFNILTAWIDGSQVYGSDIDRANWLRRFVDGKLKMSSGNFLPYNTLTGEYNSIIDGNAPSMFGDEQGGKVFVAGDIRANEQASLLSLHTLFSREHNRICDELLAQGMTGDELIYQTARKKVGALIQAVTYNEFLPALKVNLDNYTGYDDQVQPDIANIFAAAAYRLGHTVVTDRFMIIDNGCVDMMEEEGGMDIMTTFFRPDQVALYDVDPFLKGLSMKMQQDFDVFVIDALRNLLFLNTPLSVAGIDLIAFNLQRGRDHGLPDFNSIRTQFTGQTATSFADITSDASLQTNLATAYNNDVNDIDPWIGFMSEDAAPNSIFGPTLHSILKDQFQRLRDGDRFFYENDPLLASTDIQEINTTKLSHIIMRNTNIDTIDEDVFHVSECRMASVECEEISDKELERIGALYGAADFILDGNEIYTWYDATTGEQVAEFVGNPYFSPNALGTYNLIVTDPDLPDCPQTFTNRTINELNGCCELDD